jgi:glycosyltransferase involved in cell wall biosynthesis
MHIDVGMIIPGRAGGIRVTENALVSELRKHSGVTVDVFEFGSRIDNETVLQRVFGRARDVVTYYRRISRKKPNIVYINSYFDRRALIRDIWYAFVSHIRRVALVVKFHGSDESVLRRRFSLWRVVTRIIFRWSQCIVVLSRDEMEMFRSASFDSPKLRLMKNCLALSRFSEPGHRKLEPPGILFIGRFIEEKGLLDLLRAASLLADSGRSFTVYCVGDGPIRKVAEGLTGELRLGNHVKFVGFVSEDAAANYYLRCTVLAFPSYFQEGLPMTILQAVAAGLPIVSTRVRAVGDYLTEPANCLWVEPRDPATLAKRLCEILDSTELRKCMAEENRRLARTFAAEAVAQEYMQLFKEISSSP